MVSLPDIVGSNEHALQGGWNGLKKYTPRYFAYFRSKMKGGIPASISLAQVK